MVLISQWESQLETICNIFGSQIDRHITLSVALHKTELGRRWDFRGIWKRDLSLQLIREYLFHDGIPEVIQCHLNGIFDAGHYPVYTMSIRSGVQCVS